MAREYIERRDDTFYIAGSRVPLEVVIHEYQNGAPAESIADSFPTLTLEQIYGALAFYHGNKTQVEEAMRSTDRKWQEFDAKHPAPGPLRAKLELAKQGLARRG
ncbi:MAG: DUF433 domain-containing protein [Acidobacteriaceae bacterium]|nr:DUF433 domain-containing protein [Acidobacteriaceae bacterium]MBV9767563.1 DUF433 domain-containing protein [Acidobacteriaceae bacterium]